MNDNKYDQISELIASFTQIYANFAKKYGFNYNELHFLYYISGHEEATLSDISKKWSIPKQTLNSIRNKFLKQDLIVLVRDEKDKRKHFVEVTDKGEKVINEMVQLLTNAEQEASKEISEKEFELFKATFIKLKQNLIESLD